MAKANFIPIVKYLLTVDNSGSSRIGIDLGNGNTHQLTFNRNDIDVYSSIANMLRNYTCYWETGTNSITTNWV